MDTIVSNAEAFHGPGSVIALDAGFLRDTFVALLEGRPLPPPPQEPEEEQQHQEEEGEALSGVALMHCGVMVVHARALACWWYRTSCDKALTSVTC
jgi:hypothetical protein